MRVGAGLLLLWLAGSVAAQTPREIVDQAIQAHGGSDFLTKTKAMTQSAKGKVSIHGVDVDAEREGKWALPDRVSWSIDISFGGQKKRTLHVLNGLSGWRMIDANPPEELNANLFDTVSDETHVYWLSTIAPLTRKELTLAAAKGTPVNGQPTNAVKVSQPGKPEVTLFFDQRSGLLVKAAFRGRDVTGLVEKEFVFSDHKEVSGIKLPMKELDYHKSLRMGEWTIKEYRFVDKLEPSTFKKP